MKNRNREPQQSRDENHSHSEEVARRAYELYEARGGEPGHEFEDWLQAEREINTQSKLAHRAEVEC
jgi:hypothetical protein